MKKVSRHTASLSLLPLGGQKSDFTAISFGLKLGVNAPTT